MRNVRTPDEIAHDFNNLLIAIIGHSDLLLMREGLDADVRRHAEAVHKAGMSAQTLVRELTAAARAAVTAASARPAGKLPGGERAAGMRPESKATDEASGGRETILVAEDEPLVGSIVTGALKRYGYTVLYAENGLDALEIAAAHHGQIDLLLTDVVMPRMDGVALARALTRLQPGVRVLFSSGHSDRALRERGACIEKVDLLRKPYAPGVLVDRVRKALDAGRRDELLTGT